MFLSRSVLVRSTCSKVDFSNDMFFSTEVMLIMQQDVIVVETKYEM